MVMQIMVKRAHCKAFMYYYTTFRDNKKREFKQINYLILEGMKFNED